MARQRPRHDDGLSLGLSLSLSLSWPPHRRRPQLGLGLDTGEARRWAGVRPISEKSARRANQATVCRLSAVGRCRRRLGRPPGDTHAKRRTNSPCQVAARLLVVVAIAATMMTMMMMTAG